MPEPDNATYGDDCVHFHNIIMDEGTHVASGCASDAFSRILKAAMSGEIPEH